MKADEVAIVMRFGRIVGDSPGDRSTGLTPALPRPIDEVVRVQVEKVHEVEITDSGESRPSIQGAQRRPDDVAGGGGVLPDR